MSAARQRCYMARVNAEYLMRRRHWRKKEEDERYVTMGTNCEKLLRMVQHKKCSEASLGMVKRKTGHKEMGVEKLNGVVGMRCMLPLCHPFTAIASGPTGCGKTAWVLRLLTTFGRRWNLYR